MRRDWEYVRILLDVSEQLAGHPNLKDLRDDALADLKDLAEALPEGAPIGDAEPLDDEVPIVTGRRRI